ncbi:MAG: DNA mismatch repair endonuclease MutL [Planctomycetota bacterium]|nr:DNA mismatch repair endonuclease MutL [Planctomycetota bacterium]
MAINVLPVHLVNKIAAGEVIERPSSIVKELVENALDAGATRIDVAVEEGGRKLVAVTDNGGGMDAADAALAFAPHATSKITVEDDLYRIGTLGFRGEALASIASVSHAHIRTRRAAEESGWEIEASADQVGDPKPCPAGPGTTVSIRDLFFNTPARRKFLRTINTEFAHISEQLARLALPHPQVAFRLTHNAREVTLLPAVDSTRQRIVDLFGEDVGADLLAVSRRDPKLAIQGLVGSPAAARGAAKWQFVFLNGRYIRDRLLSHALREAYRGLCQGDRYPVAFLFLELDPGEVDVNVHPTKVEVRFRDTQMVHGELLAALKETLNRSHLHPSADLSRAGESPAPGQTGQREPLGSLESLEKTPASEAARQDSIRAAVADFLKSTPPLQPRLSFPEPLSRSAGTPLPTATLPRDPFVSSSPSSSPPLAVSREYVSEVRDISDSPRQGVLQVHNSYIVTQTDDAVVIIDQHALHERILYNELKGRLAEGKLAGQRLLIPETLTVTAAEADAAASRAELLGRLGIEVEPFGPRTLAIQQFPSLLTGRGVSPVEFLREVLDRLAEDEAADPERLLEGLLSMLACKAAVKAGDPLTGQEIDSLLARAAEADKASSCPHGRPTTLRLTLKDLEKQFHRT